MSRKILPELVSPFSFFLLPISNTTALFTSAFLPFKFFGNAKKKKSFPAEIPDARARLEMFSLFFDGVCNWRRRNKTVLSEFGRRPASPNN